MNIIFILGQIDGQEITAQTVLPARIQRPIRRSPMMRRPPPRWRPSPPRFRRGRYTLNSAFCFVTRNVTNILIFAQLCYYKQKKVINSI